jgi:hypothetical protein
MSRLILEPKQVLNLVNMCRTAVGSVPCTAEVLEALVGQVWQQQQLLLGTEEEEVTAAGLTAAAEALRMSSMRPQGLLDDTIWVTLLALAYLRKNLAGERQVWAGMEAKALEWLSSVWSEAIGRSIGSVLLFAMKLV